MAFHHLAGVTTPGAPDEIVDWFARFEAWITGTVGWIIASGVGTTNLFIRSTGEAGGLTMLYAHVWRDGGNPSRVHVEVCDDAVAPLGTHHTTRDGYVDSGGVQFAFFMSGDKDSFVISWKIGAGYRSIYAGLVYPFALTVPDETYAMIVSYDRLLTLGTSLRYHTGAWDVDGNMYDHPDMDDARRDRYDNSLALCGMYFNTGVNITGQLKHVSGEITDGGVNPEDTLTSGLPGGATEWVVLQDSLNQKFALRTGGILPIGQADGAHFAHTSGVAATVNAWFDALRIFLTGIGWTDHGDPGLWDIGRLFHSTGESTQEDIWILLAWHNEVTDQLYVYVQDDLAGTHRTTIVGSYMDGTWFPLPYWFTADLNCLALTHPNAANFHFRVWCGMGQSFAPGLYPPYVGVPLSAYSMATRSVGGSPAGGYFLRAHGGIWGTVGIQESFLSEGAVSNPNAYDGTTYLVWHFFLFDTSAGGKEPFCQVPYIFRTDGGGLAQLDTITVGAQVYTVFFETATRSWALRTA